MGELTTLDMQIASVGKKDSAEKGLIICAVLAVHEYGLEEDIQEYLDQNPNISFADLDDYIISLCPPLEIVDDEELDEEE
jgi:hypothetical protein